MIGFIRGALAEKGDGYILIDVNGIGYEVFVPANSRAYLASEGSEITVYTTMIVREDDVSLYGFSRRGELAAFKKLITVSGVGAKAGIAILSAFTLEELQQAIVFEDSKSLTRANGIGKKTAERIVLELKDKFKLDGGEAAAMSEAQVSAAGSAPSGSGRAEAIEALQALGYSRGEATSALASVKENDLTSEEYIKKALKNLF
ncbi:MAG: Holliday junction branch migration protein RuvA [Eubacterium sp.]|nr:Holliday junction branch migration protein RuvA [Candidatus Colimonas fimequi]